MQYRKLDQYQQFIHMSRYARWRDDLKRRESWEETIDRYINYFAGKCPAVPSGTVEELRNAILNLDIMPSMRALMTAGPALERDNISGYNCSYIAIDHPKSFDEICYVLMCGTGVGYSVERQYVTQLPSVAEEIFKSDTIIKVKDSKIGWATAFRELVSLLYSGLEPSWDVSAVRPSGARLRTFGGRASGPEPLERLFKFTIRMFKNATGRKLTSMECHDLVCMVADIVVVGGVRRSALISLSNLSDDRMRNAKSGQWWLENQQRALANNSAAYTEKPDIGIFMREWQALYESRSGERGIFNRAAATKQAERTGRRNAKDYEFGTNPCGEIILRSKGLCNLTEVVIREEDTLASLKEKVRLATILGTMQSTMTDFRYLRKEWQRNAEEERLLGVSLTGILDNAITNGKQGGETLGSSLASLREYVIEVNKEYAELLGINPAAAATTVKPSGTVSQLVGSASGIHPRFSPYYIRTIRGDMKDPLSQFLHIQGVPAEPDVTKPGSTWVFSFPVKSPENSIYKDDMTAIEQLELYLTYKQNWTEHNVSITVYVRESEWLEVGAWVYKHFDEVGGVSFLPAAEGGHSYRQAPYQEITEAEYLKALAKMPVISWNSLSEYEKTDSTTSSHELACVAGSCEIT